MKTDVVLLCCITLLDLGVTVTVSHGATSYPSPGYQDLKKEISERIHFESFGAFRGEPKSEALKKHEHAEDRSDEGESYSAGGGESDGGGGWYTEKGGDHGSHHDKHHIEEKKKKGDAGHELKKSSYEENEGKKSSYGGGGGDAGEHHSEGGGGGGAYFKHGKKGAKGNFKKGFRDVYHKDEKKKLDAFWKNGELSGKWHKYGHSKKQHEEKEQKKKSDKAGKGQNSKSSYKNEKGSKSEKNVENHKKIKS